MTLKREVEMMVAIIATEVTGIETVIMRCIEVVDVVEVVALLKFDASRADAGSRVSTSSLTIRLKVEPTTI